MGTDRYPTVASVPMAMIRRDERKFYWKAPATMFSMLLLGLVLAIAQHLFYRYLDGKQVSDTLKQNWVVRIGTLIAFLSKTAFVVAASIGYAQRQWFNLKNRAFKMAQVDDLTSALSDIFALFNFMLWAKAPILFLIALVTWLLPLVAIFTPGSIFVTSRQSDVSSQAVVPQLSWNGSGYYAVGPVDTQSAYQQPTGVVSKVGWATASSGEILSIPHPATNMTYNLVFNGPAIKCFAANATVQSNINSNFGFAGSGGGPDFECMVPGGDNGALTNGSAGPGDGTQEPLLDFVSQDTARIFASSMAGKSCPIGKPAQYNLCFNTTECDLYNATYNVNFTFSGSLQTVTINKVTFQQMLPARSIINYTDPDNSVAVQTQQQSYQTVMNNLGAVLVGDHNTGGSGSSQYQLTQIDWTTVDGMNKGMQQLFQNMTISLMSQQSLLLNSTASLPMPVTLQNWPPTYEYQPFDLYLAYGLSFAFSTACALIGLHAILTNGATYSNKFSTYIRSARDEELLRTLSLHAAGDDGSNPLPAPLARTRVVINSDVEKAEDEYRMLPR